MKALVKTQKGDGYIEVQQKPYPTLRGEDWVIIKVKAAGVCGTDLHIWHDMYPYWPPVILGHEFSGEIVEVGSKCSRFKVGDRIVTEPHSLACGVCDLCRQGKVQQCTEKRSPGWGIDGGFAEYVTMPEKLLHRIPDGMSYEVAALAEPMAITVHHVTELCGIGCMDTVVVSGAGPIGLIAAFVAKSAGAGKVIITGMDACEAVRFPAAAKLGADHIINVQKTNALEEVMRLTDGKGADVVIETSGATAAICDAIMMTKKYGKICAIGLGAEMSNIPFKQIVMRSLTVVGCMSSGYTAWDKGLKLMATTDKDIGCLITHKVKLDEWEKTFLDLEAEKGIKAVFLPELG